MQYDWLKDGFIGPVKGVPDVESFHEVVESFQVN